MPPEEKMLVDRHASATGVTDAPRQLQCDDLVVDLDAYRVTYDGQVIEVGPMEYRVLCFLIRQPSIVFTREELIEGVWPAGTSIDVRTIDVHIARLRRSLTRHGHADPIRTVRTVGYALG